MNYLSKMADAELIYALIKLHFLIELAIQSQPVSQRFDLLFSQQNILNCS